MALVQVGGELAQGLGHEPGLQAHVDVTHLSLDLGPGCERGHGVDHDHGDGPRADEHVGDLQSLLTGVGLGDQHLVHVHADGAGVDGVEGVLGVDVGTHPAHALRLGHDVQGQRGLAGGLGSKDLRDPPTGQTADTECHVERQRPRGHGVDLEGGLLPHLHDRALAEVLLDLAQGQFERLLAHLAVAVGGCGVPRHWSITSWVA